MTEPSCRSCGNAHLDVVLRLGNLPLANSLPTEAQLAGPEVREPLDVAFCSVCALVQITVSVAPEDLFEEYAYFSSFSTTLVERAGVLVRRMIAERSLGPDSLAVELASNDGYLLQHYVHDGVPVLGIDPAKNIAPEAEKRGVPTLCEFFGLELAEQLRAEGRQADVIHANNVMAHVPDPNGFAGGIATLLADDGVAVIETPYLRDMVEKLEFDTIYHEHLFYYSLTALGELYARNGLTIVDVEHVEIHGGSLRVFAMRTATAPEPSAAVTTMLADEKALGLTELSYYRSFNDRVTSLRTELRAFLHDLKSKGHSIGAYGAAAKGAILLNYCDIGPDILDFVADRNDYKQGRYMPGVHIPIVGSEKILADQPDYVLLLVWNFEAEIVKQEAAYLAAGGHFIIPIPSTRVV